MSSTDSRGADDGKLSHSTLNWLPGHICADLPQKWPWRLQTTPNDVSIQRKRAEIVLRVCVKKSIVPGAYINVCTWLAKSWCERAHWLGMMWLNINLTERSLWLHWSGNNNNSVSIDAHNHYATWERGSGAGGGALEYGVNVLFYAQLRVDWCDLCGTGVAFNIGQVELNWRFVDCASEIKLSAVYQCFCLCLFPFLTN